MSKRVMVLWAFVIFIMCASLLVLGNIGTDYELYKVKKSLISASREYMKDNNMQIEFNKSKYIFIDDLTNDKYIDSVDEKYCITKIKVTNNVIYKFDVISECSNK